MRIPDFDEPEPGRVYDYVVLPVGRNADVLGYSAGQRVWQNDVATVYARGPRLAHLDTLNAPTAGNFSQAAPAEVEIDADSLRLGALSVPLPAGLRGLTRLGEGQSRLHQG